jgi:UDP-hydrolysing UDP-N-acetyl-D-glucosamine 2-epimerase
MKKILALTSIRSDYDLMSGVYRRLHADQEIDLKLLVSGAHLSPAFGYTVDLIRRDGLEIVCEIESLVNADTGSARLKSASVLLSAAIDTVKNYSPDLIIYAGDREDVLIAAAIGAFLDIPTVHFFGGDHAIDGHVDNPVRHASSKLSTAHFVSMEEHRQRLIKIGEPSRRIFLIGSVALDKFVSEPHIQKSRLLSEIGAKPHATSNSLAILIFHPLEQERDVACLYIRNAVSVLIEAGYHVLVGSPNSDPGNSSISDVLDGLNQLPELTYYRNISRSLFINLMRNASVMIGNSSAGILEAASLQLPVINIGERQKGRFCGSNVIFSEGGLDSIKSALSRIHSGEFVESIKGLVNPYGNGNSVDAAVSLLKNTDFRAMQKKGEDPLDDAA